MQLHVVSTARPLRPREAHRGREALPQEDAEEEKVQERSLRRGGPLLVPGELEVRLPEDKGGLDLGTHILVFHCRHIVSNDDIRPDN